MGGPVAAELYRWAPLLHLTGMPHDAEPAPRLCPFPVLPRVKFSSQPALRCRMLDETEAREEAGEAEELQVGGMRAGGPDCTAPVPAEDLCSLPLL